MKLTMAKKKFYHDCQLRKQSETAEIKYGRLKRFLINVFYIAKTEEVRKIFRTSKFGIKMERERQQKYFPTIIHPFSIFRFSWEVFMVLVFLIQMSLLALCTKSRTSITHCIVLIYVNLVIDIISVVDIMLNFKTGIFDSVKHEIILEQKHFIRVYCTKYFITDFIPSIPFLYIYYVKENRMYSRSALVVCKFLHIVRLMCYLNRLQEKRQWALPKFRIGRTIINFCLLFSFCICLLGIIRSKDPNLPEHRIYNLKTYISLISSTTNMIFGLGASTFVFYWQEILVHITGRFCGTVLMVYFVVYVTCYYTHQNQTRHRYLRQQNEMERFLRLESFPPDIVKDINKFHMYHYEGKYYNERLIWRHVSDDLRCRVICNILKDIIKTDIFSLGSWEMIYMISLKLHKRRYLHGMEICSAGTENTMMIIISSGSVKLLTQDNQEAGIIYQGKVFHDVLPLTEENKGNRMYSIVANEFCVIFKLLYKKLDEIAINFPGVQEMINKLLAKKTRVILDNPNNLDKKLYFD